MKLTSIRWQLPLSYAAIALLAALSLGAVLIFTIQGYYQRQERDYLVGNARVVSQAVAQMIQEGYTDAAIQDLLDGLSSLIQVRILLLDEQGEPRVDTGMPKINQVTTFSGPQGETDVSFRFNQAESCVAEADPSGENPPNPAEDCPPPEMAMLAGGTVNIEGGPGNEISGGGTGMSFSMVAPVGTSLYGFDLTSSSDGIRRRSHQSVGLQVAGSSGQVLGSLELSDGPAYGQEIVDSVARAWAIAGLAAVLLAALAGWFISQKMARPILTLAQATQKMAEGDLSARAEVRTPDEMVVLSNSFNEMAERVGEMISTLRNFVSDAAHELHTPLTALRTNLELIASDPQNSAVFAGEALQQADRLQALVNGLLDLSRIEAQNRTHEPVELSGLLEGLSEPYASQAEQAGLAFELKLPDIPVAVKGDEAQLRSAVGNLLDNAIKFTPGGGRVGLSLDVEEGTVRVRVEDNGIGIPLEELPSLFSRFHRARNAAAYPGNGLGLAIVKAVAEAHNGIILVESTEQGTRFELRLPLA